MISLNELKKNLNNYFVLWLTGGIVYYFAEIFCRGYSHFSMLICGGLCFLIVGIVGNKIVRNERRIISGIFKIMIFGSMTITTLEYITGLIVNIRYGLNVWDYSDMKYNVDGQICLLYSLIWGLMSLICVFMNSIIEDKILKNNQT